MPNLDFKIEGAEVVEFSATPQIAFKLKLTNADPAETIHSVALRCQIQIEVTRRRYTTADQERLRDLFGEADRWSQTLRNLLWTHVSVNVPPFQGVTVVDVQVPCTFDFNVAATKYFHGLGDGDVPAVHDVQRYRLPCARRWKPASHADFLGQGSALQSAREGVARHDGVVLPRDRLVVPAPRCVRAPVRLQGPARNSHVGRNDGAHASGGRDGELMNVERVDQIAKAVLYEGYMLYPYRPSSVKNQQRWNFGVLYPQTYSSARGGEEACSMRTECLITGNPGTALEVKLRFLHLRLRSTSLSSQSSTGSLPNGWQEAVERDVSLPASTLHKLMLEPLKYTFTFPAKTQVDSERDCDGQVVGTVVRRQADVRGIVDVTIESVGTDLFKVSIFVRNTTPLEVPETGRDEALMQSLVSTHIILGVEEGEFVSLLEPPTDLQGLAAKCQNVGAWPVLVGDEGQTRHSAGFTHHSLRLSPDRSRKRR